ncbi:MAG: hypothetical protein IPO26_21015 [Saprospiraceae bacterium]|nr:hypothetical protein [Saprospiraceae bacterium]
MVRVRKTLFFGIAPILPIKDTTLLEDESVQVEIWYHDSPRLYTQMEANIENDRKKSYAIMYDLDSLRFTSLESLDADRSIISAKVMEDIFFTNERKTISQRNDMAR